MHKKILIIADLEGSSCCYNYEATTFLHPEWPDACLGLSLDINSVVKALFKAGVEKIYVKDFHRTAYNLVPELIDKRAEIISGYHVGPVPGLGDPFDSTAVMMIGLHAPSGSEGFLPHTLTSRIARLEVNGRLMSEIQLFAASLAPYNIKPIFFSGCPVACQYASDEIKGLRCYSTQKHKKRTEYNPELWREKLAKEAVSALGQEGEIYRPAGKFKAVLTMRDGENYTRKIAERWKYEHNDNQVFINAGSIHELYHCLIRLCYFTPLIEKILPIGLALFNLRGRAGLLWVKTMIKKKTNAKY